MIGERRRMKFVLLLKREPRVANNCQFPDSGWQSCNHLKNQNQHVKKTGNVRAELLKMGS